MAKHMVKCPICQQTFDANEVPFVMVGTRRYAHKECQEKAEKQKQLNSQDNQFQLEQYIKKLFGYTVLPERVKRQIKQYVKDKGYTYSGIHKTLIYWFEVRKGDIEKAHGGIGIVEFVYKEAYNYYKAIYEARETNEKRVIDTQPIKETDIHISPPERKPMKHLRKLFTFLEEGEMK